ncbi:MAG: hypothetical protein ACPL1I_09515, partial [bacterium]
KVLDKLKQHNILLWTLDDIKRFYTTPSFTSIYNSIRHGIGNGNRTRLLNRMDTKCLDLDVGEVGFEVLGCGVDGVLDSSFCEFRESVWVGYRSQFTSEYSKHASFERSLSKYGENNYKVSENACQCLSRHLLSFSVLKGVSQWIKDSILNMKRKVKQCIFKLVEVIVHETKDQN